jgi:hypothetical protein
VAPMPHQDPEVVEETRAEMRDVAAHEPTPTLPVENAAAHTGTSAPVPAEQRIEQPLPAVPVGAEAVSEIPPSSAPFVGSAPHAEPSPAVAVVTAAALKLEWPSDLVQVETDPHKAREAAAYVEAEPVAHVRRMRPAPVPISDQPLVQVETRPSAASRDAQPGSASFIEREAASSVGHGSVLR